MGLHDMAGDIEHSSRNALARGPEGYSLSERRGSVARLAVVERSVEHLAWQTQA